MENKEFIFIENDSEFMKPVILIGSEKTELLTNSSLMLIKGESGSGKSRLAMNFILGLLTGHEDLGFDYTICPEDKYVIYINTELSRYSMQRRRLKISSQLTEKQNAKFKMVDFNGIHPHQKLDQLNKLADMLPPYVVIIDQLADFVVNINETEECTTLINKIMNGIDKRDCAIIAIIHQNEDSGISTKARGHIGSATEMKTVCSIAISSSSRGFSIQTTKLREGRQVKLFASFNEETEMLILSKETNLDDLVSKIKFPCAAAELDNQIAKITNKSVSYARNMKTKLIEEGKITFTKEGKENIFSKAASCI